MLLEILIHFNPSNLRELLTLINLFKKSSNYVKIIYLQLLRSLKHFFFIEINVLNS